MAGGFQPQPRVIRAARRWSPEPNRSLQPIFQKATNPIYVKHLHFRALATQTPGRESSGTRF